MTNARNRKEASKRLGLSLRRKYRDLVEASSEDEISNAAIVLGAEFNTNIEYVIWVLLEYGGMEQMPFQPATKSKEPELPKTPSILLN